MKIKVTAIFNVDDSYNDNNTVLHESSSSVYDEIFETCKLTIEKVNKMFGTNITIKKRC